LPQLELQIEQVTLDKEEAVAEQDFDRAIQLRDQQLQLQQQRDTLWNDWLTHHPIDLAWLEWNGGTVPRFAQAIAKGRLWELLPLLGEILVAAGCRDETILGHCRDGKRHGDRCWLTDLLRAKNGRGAEER
jgi:hypothetical protein